MDTQKFPPCPYCGSTEMRTGFQTYEATVKKQRGSMMGGSTLQHLFCSRCGMVAASRVLRPENIRQRCRQMVSKQGGGGRTVFHAAHIFWGDVLAGPVTAAYWIGEPPRLRGMKKTGNAVGTILTAFLLSSSSSCACAG